MVDFNYTALWKRKNSGNGKNAIRGAAQGGIGRWSTGDF